MFTPRGGKYQVPYRAAHTYFRAVAEAGAKIYLYQDGYFHPKTLTIDGAVTAVGTANMDIRSFSLNYETMAILYDEEKARELERQFLADLEHCTEWTLAAYERASGRPSPGRLALPPRLAAHVADGPPSQEISMG